MPFSYDSDDDEFPGNGSLLEQDYRGNGYKTPRKVPGYDVAGGSTKGGERSKLLNSTQAFPMFKFSEPEDWAKHPERRVSFGRCVQIYPFERLSSVPYESLGNNIPYDRYLEDAPAYGDLLGSHELRRLFLQAIQFPIQYDRHYCGLNSPPHMLHICGREGSGKRTAVLSMSRKYGINVLVTGTYMMDDWTFTDAIRWADRNQPCILYVDGAECFVGNRAPPSQHMRRDALVNQAQITFACPNEDAKAWIILGTNTPFSELDSRVRVIVGSHSVWIGCLNACERAVFIRNTIKYQLEKLGFVHGMSDKEIDEICKVLDLPGENYPPSVLRAYIAHVFRCHQGRKLWQCRFEEVLRRLRAPLKKYLEVDEVTRDSLFALDEDGVSRLEQGMSLLPHDVLGDANDLLVCHATLANENRFHAAFDSNAAHAGGVATASASSSSSASASASAAVAAAGATVESVTPTFVPQKRDFEVYLVPGRGGTRQLITESYSGDRGVYSSESNRTQLSFMNHDRRNAAVIRASVPPRGPTAYRAPRHPWPAGAAGTTQSSVERGLHSTGTKRPLHWNDDSLLSISSPSHPSYENEGANANADARDGSTLHEFHGEPVAVPGSVARHTNTTEVAMRRSADARAAGKEAMVEMEPAPGQASADSKRPRTTAPASVLPSARPSSVIHGSDTPAINPRYLAAPGWAQASTHSTA